MSPNISSALSDSNYAKFTAGKDGTVQLMQPSSSSPGHREGRSFKGTSPSPVRETSLANTPFAGTSLAGTPLTGTSLVGTPLDQDYLQVLPARVTDHQLSVPTLSRASTDSGCGTLTKADSNDPFCQSSLKKQSPRKLSGIDAILKKSPGANSSTKSNSSTLSAKLQSRNNAIARMDTSFSSGLSSAGNSSCRLASYVDLLNRNGEAVCSYNNEVVPAPIEDKPPPKPKLPEAAFALDMPDDDIPPPKPPMPHLPLPPTPHGDLFDETLA